MKTLIKWSASTIISFLVICFFSILLTGHTISEESSKLGKTVYSAGNAVTYDKKMDVTFSMPKDWNRYFADTRNGMSNPATCMKPSCIPLSLRSVPACYPYISVPCVLMDLNALNSGDGKYSGGLSLQP